MITREQCRAARALLEWSQQDLAIKARVGISTVRDFEKGRHFPQRRNLEMIEGALEAAGVIFIPEDAGIGPGVRLTRPVGRS